MGVERRPLQLPRASGQLLGPSGGRDPIGCSCGRPTRRPSSTRPSCALPQPPPAASSTAASIPATIGLICAILAHLARLLAHAIGLWREQLAALSAASERRSGNATQAGKEGSAGMLMLRHPSRWLARAMAGRSPCQTREIVGRWLLLQLSSHLDGAHGRTLMSAVHERAGGNVQFTSFEFCDGDRSAAR